MLGILQSGISITGEVQPMIESTSIDQLVGNTPLLAFRRVTAHLPAAVKVLGKAEWTNPAGSVKDRPALNIMREAMRRGDLRPGGTLIDSTSGNTGIAYGLYGRALGIDVALVIPSNVSPERLAILRALGVRMILSDPAEGSDGAIRLVRQMVDDEPERYFYANQYNNPDNWQAHYKGTGPELWQQTGGQITHFVAGLGTSGTLMGTGRRLKEYNPAISLVGIQPDSPFHGLEGLKHMPTAIQPGIYDEALIDIQMEVQTEDAHEMCRRLAREEGVLVGVSAAAAMVAAVRLAESLTEGVVVALMPDSATKYLSDPFWTA